MPRRLTRSVRAPISSSKMRLSGLMASSLSAGLRIAKVAGIVSVLRHGLRILLNTHGLAPSDGTFQGVDGWPVREFFDSADGEFSAARRVP